jgi:hypothetical protein
MNRVLLFALLTATAFAQSKPPAWHQKSPSAAHVTLRTGKRLGASISCPALPGGTPHEIEFCWTTPQAGTTALFLATGACPASGVPAGTQEDSTTALSGSFLYTNVKAAGTYCGYATVTGVTAPSNTVQVTIPVFAPTNLNCAQISNTMNAACAWTASTDSGTTVTVLDSTSANGPFALVASGLAAGGPYTISNLTAGVHYIEIEATVGGVTSPVSAIFPLTITAPQGNPPNFGMSAQ